MRTLISIALVSSLMLASCGKSQAIVITKQDAESAALEPAALAQKPWYAQRLEQLGFYVFPSPEELPPISVQTRSGQSVGLEVVKGKLTILNFWATWCPPCRAEMPSIQTLYEQTRELPLAVMAISVNESASTVAAFLKDNPFTFPVYLDESGRASAPFVNRGIPSTFILDKQGRAIAGIVGSRSYDGPEVVTIMKELAQKLP